MLVEIVACVQRGSWLSRRLKGPQGAGLVQGVSAHLQGVRKEGSMVASGQRAGTATIIPPEPDGHSGQPGQEPEAGHGQVEKQ